MSSSALMSAVPFYLGGGVTASHVMLMVMLCHMTCDGVSANTGASGIFLKLRSACSLESASLSADGVNS